MSHGNLREILGEVDLALSIGPAIDVRVGSAGEDDQSKENQGGAHSHRIGFRTDGLDRQVSSARHAFPRVQRPDCVPDGTIWVSLGLARDWPWTPRHRVNQMERPIEIPGSLPAGQRPEKLMEFRAVETGFAIGLELARPLIRNSPVNPPKTLLRPAPNPDREVVLVVDDERGPRESLRMILQPNYEVLVARDGSEALQLLRSQPVDLVTLDLSMPGIHGEELMRLMRQEFPEVEVVIITGHGSLENATRAIRYGVADYLQKPFDVVQVSAAVFRCLSRRRGRTRLVGFLSSLGETVGYQDQIESLLEQASQDPRIGQRIGSLLDAKEGESRASR